MSIAALWSRVSTNQIAMFSAARRDAGLFAPVGFAHPSHLLGAALRASFAPAGRHRGHVLTAHRP